VHVSHNHEERLWRSMAQQASVALPRRVALWQNAQKVRALERRLLREVDLVTTITEEDERSLGAHRSGRILTLTPGYDGAVAPPRMIDAATPRRAVIVGSFNWVVKRENLARFIESADPLFARHDVELIVAGDVPRDLQDALRAKHSATQFVGYVTDLLALLSQARIAVAPELIGGGFKLKFLDYFFGRIPVATIAGAAAGLPATLRRTLLMSDDFAGLAATIVEHMDQIDALNAMQSAAFERARTLFRWDDRGAQLREHIAQLQRERAGERLQAAAL
jgi:glycosyltransferase involved in cell wall biosynthesis